MAQPSKFVEECTICSTHYRVVARRTENANARLLGPLLCAERRRPYGYAASHKCNELSATRKLAHRETLPYRMPHVRYGSEADFGSLDRDVPLGPGGDIHSIDL